MLAVLGASSLLVSGGAASAYVLSIAPVSQAVGLGGEVTVAINVSGVQPGGLGSYDFRFNYDNTVLAFDRANDSLGLGLAFGLGVSPLANSLQVSDFSLETEADLLALQRDAFTLFTLVFDSIAVGTSALDMTGITLSDSGGRIVAFAADTGSVTVRRAADVPEPASWALVGLALGLGLCTSRRNRAIKA